MAHSHKRETHARRKLKPPSWPDPSPSSRRGAASPSASLAPPPGTGRTHDAISSQGAATQRVAQRRRVSRSESRLAADARSSAARRRSGRTAYDARQTQARPTARQRADVRCGPPPPLNLWTGPDEQGEARSGLIDAGRRSSSPDAIRRPRRARRRRQRPLGHRGVPLPGPAAPTQAPPRRRRVALRGALRVAAPPTPSQTPSASPSETPAPTGLSTAPCPDGSVENGLTSDAVCVYRSVCHAFPQITSYGGWDAHGEHASGKAIDIMTSDKALGNAIAAFLQSHASELTSTTSSGGTRSGRRCGPPRAGGDYGDHGSPTANHMDHVHVSTN